MKKYLLIFQAWDSGAYSFAAWSTTKIIEASPENIQAEIEQANEKADMKRPGNLEKSVLHQIISLEP